MPPATIFFKKIARMTEATQQAARFFIFEYVEELCIIL